jgi:hypothetical protein
VEKDQNEFRSIRGDGFYGDEDDDNGLKTNNRTYYFGDMRFYEDIGIRCVSDQIAYARRGSAFCYGNHYPYPFKSFYRNLVDDSNCTTLNFLGFRCTKQ